MSAQIILFPPARRVERQRTEAQSTVFGDGMMAGFDLALHIFRAMEQRQAAPAPRQKHR